MALLPVRSRGQPYACLFRSKFHCIQWDNVCIGLQGKGLWTRSSLESRTKQGHTLQRSEIRKRHMVRRCTYNNKATKKWCVLLVWQMPDASFHGHDLHLRDNTATVCVYRAWEKLETPDLEWILPKFLPVLTTMQDLLSKGSGGESFPHTAQHTIISSSNKQSSLALRCCVEQEDKNEKEQKKVTKCF